MAARLTAAAAFFQPTGQRLAPDAKDAFDPAQARSFVVGGDDPFFVARTVDDAGLQHPAAATRFAHILLFALGIMTIFDQGLALTFRTFMDLACRYHSTILSYHSLFNHYPVS